MYNFKECVLNGYSYPHILILFLTVTILLYGCSDSGSVGGLIDNEQADLQVDTLETTQFGTDTLASYSGRNNFFSAGQFQDPLFGNVMAMGLLKPILPRKLDGVQFVDSSNFMLRLAINKEAVYGDSLANVNFKFVEINESWRAPAWRLNDEIQLSEGPEVASFGVTTQDSIDVTLSDNWVQKYASFYNRTDSTRNDNYRRNFFGLAMVIQNTGKIVTINPTQSRFIATKLDNSADTSQSDSISVNLSDNAFSAARSNVPDSGSESTKIYNTLERVITLDFEFDSEVIKPINIAKAELVLYRDVLMLDESIKQAGTDAVRPNAGPLRLHVVEGDELPQSIDPGTPISQGIYREEDEAYHFNLSGLIRRGFFEQANSSLQLYITQGINDGVIRSNILFNNQSGENAPKLIITSTKNS